MSETLAIPLNHQQKKVLITLRQACEDAKVRVEVKQILQTSNPEQRVLNLDTYIASMKLQKAQDHYVRALQQLYEESMQQKALQLLDAMEAAEKSDNMNQTFWANKWFKLRPYQVALMIACIVCLLGLQLVHMEMVVLRRIEPYLLLWIQNLLYLGLLVNILLIFFPSLVRLWWIMWKGEDHETK